MFTYENIYKLQGVLLSTFIPRQPKKFVAFGRFRNSNTNVGLPRDDSHLGLALVSMESEEDFPIVVAL